LMANMGLDAAAFALCTRENLLALRQAIPLSCCGGQRGAARDTALSEEGDLEASPLIHKTTRATSSRGPHPVQAAPPS
jgi:hypothetical protein